jgi:hypothetical protein
MLFKYFIRHSLRCAHFIFLLALLTSAGCATSVQVRIESQPPGAEVWVHSESVRKTIGTTPTSVTVRQGEDLDLEITYKDKLTQSRHISNIRGNRTVSVQFPLTGKIKIRTEPPGATIQFLSSEGTELTLRRDDSIVSGGATYSTNRIYYLPESIFSGNADDFNLTVLIERDGYQPLRKKVRIAPYEDLELEFALESAPTNYEIVSAPAGAEVYERVLGYLGRTPLALELEWEKLERLTSTNLESGDTVPLQLTLRKSGYADLERTESLRVGFNNGRLSTSLREKSPVRLRVESLPSGARVFDRTLGLIGTTPLTKEFSPGELSRLGVQRDVAGSEFINLSLTLLKDGYQANEQGVSVLLTGTDLPTMVTVELIPATTP